MWHFPSRSQFLREASRVLRQDATLVVVDILIVNDAVKTIGWSREEMLRTLRGGFAPWPEPGTTVEDIVALAGVAGLECGAVIDATNETKPTYADHGDSTARPGAAAFSETAAVRLFVEMHQQNLLKVVYLQFRKTGRPIAVAVRTDHER